MCTSALVCACMQRPKVDTGIFLSHVLPYSLRQVRQDLSIKPQIHHYGPEWLPSLLQGCPGLAGCHAQPAFMKGMGS